MPDSSFKAAMLLIVLALLCLSIAAAAQPPPSLASIIEFNTLCAACHAGECSGRLSFDSGPEATRSHIERHRGTTEDAAVADLFAMLRYVKENCRNYPVVPLRPAVGSWEPVELSPWHNARAGAYFIPLGRLPPGRRRVILEFDHPADGFAHIDDELMAIVADERLCRDQAKTLELDASADTSYYLHIKAGTSVLSGITFR